MKKGRHFLKCGKGKQKKYWAFSLLLFMNFCFCHTLPGFKKNTFILDGAVLLWR
jgi:hypothetical protein